MSNMIENIREIEAIETAFMPWCFFVAEAFEAAVPIRGPLTG